MTKLQQLRAIDKLIKKEMRRQALRHPRLRSRRTQAEKDRLSVARWLFNDVPSMLNRAGCPSKDDRDEKWRRKDCRWMLGYLKAQRLGLPYEID